MDSAKVGNPIQSRDSGYTQQLSLPAASAFGPPVGCRRRASRPRDHHRRHRRAPGERV